MRKGREEEVAACLRAVRGPTRAEAGCVYFEALRSSRDPRLFWVHSRWHDETAFDLHAELPYTVRFLDAWPRSSITSSRSLALGRFLDRILVESAGR